jgi:hypothetical protein
MAEHDELLRRFAPRLRYDSNEQYFADSAAQWTDNPGNELRRGDGARIAAQPPLALGFLAAGAYEDGTPVEKGDHIGDPRGDYRKQYMKLRMDRADLKNRMYGRAVEANGRLWLQYWFWYFYNDYSLALGAGLHEGDWEMVQLRIHEDEPDVAVYAQHTHGEERPWREVERDGDHPVVYVARGSHAAYFEAGFHETDAWYDLADGKRDTPELALEIVTEPPAWLLWPGRWGDTKPLLPGGLHQPSPTAPCVHSQWRNPDKLLDDAWTPKRREAPEAHEVRITRVNGRLRIDYDFERHGSPPHTLVLTVNSRDEKGVPPQTHTFQVETAVRGRLDTAIALDPDKHYDIYTSTTTGMPPVPSASTLTEVGPLRGPMKAALLQGVAQKLGTVVAWIRGHLKRRRAG